MVVPAKEVLPAAAGAAVAMVQAVAVHKEVMEADKLYITGLCFYLFLALVTIGSIRSSVQLLPGLQ